jgi:hypothetical protein
MIHITEVSATSSLESPDLSEATSQPDGEPEAHGHLTPTSYLVSHCGPRSRSQYLTYSRLQATGQVTDCSTSVRLYSPGLTPFSSLHVVTQKRGGYQKTGIRFCHSSERLTNGIAVSKASPTTSNLSCGKTPSLSPLTTLSLARHDVLL